MIQQLHIERFSGTDFYAIIIDHGLNLLHVSAMTVISKIKARI